MKTKERFLWKNGKTKLMYCIGEVCIDGKIRGKNQNNEDFSLLQFYFHFEIDRSFKRCFASIKMPLIQEKEKEKLMVSAILKFQRFYEHNIK